MWPESPVVGHVSNVPLGCGHVGNVPHVLDSDGTADAVLATGPRGQRAHSPAQRVKIDPENVRNGLGQLVLTLVELIRELLERQAIRRMDAGSLTSLEIERVGLAMFRLAEEIEVLKDHFGLTDEDLNLDLGPLGTLR